MDSQVATPPTPTTGQQALLTAWPKSAQLAVTFLVGVVATLLATYFFSLTHWRTQPADLQHIESQSLAVDLNHAGRAELLLLPGVGEAMADRIIAYRNANGPFRNVNDLRRVNGVGPALIGRIRDQVFVDAALDMDNIEPMAANRSPLHSKGTPSSADARKSTSRKEGALVSQIDINRANAEELQKLPGIGPKLAQRILDERAKQRFQSIEALRRVSGIGAKTLERLRPFVMVNQAKQTNLADSRASAASPDGE
jgi:competence protein ComEA